MNETTRAALVELLVELDRADQAEHYDRRNRLLCMAVVHAQQLGYRCGCRIDQKEPDWPVLFLELPTGQISYHLPQHALVWDGHTPEEKRQRLWAFVRLPIDK